MKKITILMLLFVATVFSANARIWTVNKNSNSPGELTDLQLACDTASAGDTILVSATENLAFASINITKQLTLLGIGNTENTYVRCNGITLNGEVDEWDNVISTSSGTIIKGFYTQISTNNPGVSIQIENIIIANNHITEFGTWVSIQNSIIYRTLQPKINTF